jgi:hypothetical protein
VYVMVYATFVILCLHPIGFEVVLDNYGREAYTCQWSLQTVRDASPSHFLGCFWCLDSSLRGFQATSDEE